MISDNLQVASSVAISFPSSHPFTSNSILLRPNISQPFTKKKVELISPLPKKVDGAADAHKKGEEKPVIKAEEKNPKELEKAAEYAETGRFQATAVLQLPTIFHVILQPVSDTRQKQVQLWKELILDYCRSLKIFVIGLEEEFSLFSNPVIERSLSHEAREAFLSALVSEGRAEWLDKGHRKCLILWHRVPEWADIITHFVKDNGFEDSVLTVEEIRSGMESRGTELHGIDRTVLMRALKVLEQKGKVAIFKGTSTDDEGLKFSL